ncbi:MAG TPA: N-acetylglucosamine-6-phosphate deacetylase [Solirubrobacteraceae bacterium]|nr:N-acetylglucosamine-6-phosphate deacetylase [Solirubrobacteraceae bacterium]
MSARDESLLLAGGRVVTPDGVIDGGWVHVAGPTIVAVGAGDRPPASAIVDLEGAWLVPGFVDLHMHGGGGHNVAESRAAMAAAVAFHRDHGTTSTLVSLVTAPVDALQRQLRWVAELARRGDDAGPRVLGAHLEGPFLSTLRCGAQNASFMLAPDVDVLERLLEAGDGCVRVVTIAPELDGALALVRRLRAVGVVVALGHSDASYEQGIAAVRAGASLATHLFNGMRPLHHRDPGLVAASLHAQIACELIGDGIHLHPAVVALVNASIPRPVLITDAIDAAGVGEGLFDLGGQRVRVVGREARLERNGSLAGSTLTMDDAVRRAVLDSGLSLVQACAAAAGNPAAVLGLDDTLGSVAPGQRADLVVLDDDLRVRDVMTGGVWRTGTGS